MRLLLIAGCLALFSIAECRVRFTYSSIYDEYDLIEQSKVPIDECLNVTRCAIFVSISKDPKYKDVYSKIQVARSTPNGKIMNLNELAAQRNFVTREITPYFVSTAGSLDTVWISNTNEKRVAAPFVIYSVNLSEEPNFIKTSGVFDAADLPNGGAQRGKIVTVMSAVPFTTTIEGNENTTARVFTAGFDNAYVYGNNPDKCRTLLQTSLDKVASFQINGPIVSIAFSDSPIGQLVDSKNIIKTSLTYAYDNLDMKSYGFVMSQGFIGCSSGEAYRSSIYEKSVRFNLRANDIHFVHLKASIYTDFDHLLRLTTDDDHDNMIATSLLQTTETCVPTKKLTVDFDQTGANSFALVYQYNGKDCNGKMNKSVANPKIRALRV